MARLERADRFFAANELNGNITAKSASGKVAKSLVWRRGLTESPGFRELEHVFLADLQYRVPLLQFCLGQGVLKVVTLQYHPGVFAMPRSGTANRLSPVSLRRNHDKISTSCRRFRGRF